MAIMIEGSAKWHERASCSHFHFDFTQISVFHQNINFIVQDNDLLNLIANIQLSNLKFQK